MPNREDLLREKTHKGQTESLDTRVFYTLHDSGGPPSSSLETHRTTKAISLLFKHLHEHGILSEEAIDDILLEAVSA